MFSRDSGTFTKSKLLLTATVVQIVGKLETTGTIGN